MARKSRTKRSRGAPNRGDRPGVRLLSPAIAVIRSHQAAFHAWLVDPGGDDADAVVVVDDLEAIVDFARRAGLPLDPLATDPAVLGEIRDALMDDAATLEAVALWVEFAGSAGLWTGTPSQHTASLAVIRSPAPPDRDVASADDVAAAVAALPLAHSVRSLLAWVRPGRGVTGTGAVRRADLLEAGNLAGGQLFEGVDPDSGVPAVLRPTGDPEWPSSVHTMRDAWELHRLWGALADEGLIEVGATRARLTPTGEQLLDDGGGPDWRVVHDVAVSALVSLLRDPWNLSSTPEHRGAALREVLESLVLAPGPRHEVEVSDLSPTAMYATPPLRVLGHWGVVELTEAFEPAYGLRSITVVSVGRDLVPLLAVALLSAADDG